MFKNPDVESLAKMAGLPGAVRVESGVAQVGNKTDVKSRMQVAVKFNTPFEAPPCVVANALEAGQNDYPDSFAVTICNVSTTGFDARVRRVDLAEQGWGQALQLSWVAVGPR
jgi:hypothetical protein